MLGCHCVYVGVCVCVVRVRGGVESVRKSEERESNEEREGSEEEVNGRQLSGQSVKAKCRTAGSITMGIRFNNWHAIGTRHVQSPKNHLTLSIGQRKYLFPCGEGSPFSRHLHSYTSLQ